MASVSKRPRKKADGTNGDKWIVRYIDLDGSHRQSTYDTKKEADAYKRQIERGFDDGTHIAGSKARTVAQVVDEYLANLSRRADDAQVSSRYVDTHRRSLKHAVRMIGAVLVKDLTWQLVEDYGRRLRKVPVPGGGTLANGTVKLCLASLRMAVGYGVRRGYAMRNVVPDAVKEIGQLPVAGIETFSREEMQRLVAEIEVRASRQSARTQAFLRAAVYLAGMCGLRRGEILALRWEDIDFDAREVRVRHSITLDDLVKAPKTDAGKRTVPLPRLAADALRAWEPYVVADDRGLIFRSKGGGSWQDASFYRDTWHPLLDRAGIVAGRKRGHRHFHALRHFAGSAWLEGGVPLPDVSRLLGHANMAITAQIYAHAITDVHHRAPEIDACAGLLAAPPLRMSCA